MKSISALLVPAVVLAVGLLFLLVATDVFGRLFGGVLVIVSLLIIMGMIIDIVKTRR